MKVTSTSLPGVLLVEPTVFGDARGWFVETFHEARYRAAGIDLPFVQDNQSSSVRGTLRGLHFQRRKPQGKLLWVVRGEIFDVAVDLRRDSPGFGAWYGTTLSAEDHRQIWLPPGFAHGFLVTSEAAEVVYKVTAPYDRQDERAIRWDDPALNIRWPLDGAPILSARDAAAPRFADAELP